MSTLQNLLLAAVIGSASFGSLAQTSAEHAQHHPQGAASAPVAAQPSSARAALNPEQTAAMDKHMQAMQEMHQKMLSARTPEERQVAMAEHMKLMLDGGMPMMPMMQTMMERLPAAPAKPAR